MARATGNTPETHLSMEHRTTDKRRPQEEKEKIRKDESERYQIVEWLLEMSY